MKIIKTLREQNAAELTINEFMEHFVPLRNPDITKKAYDGFGFDVYGDDLEYVKNYAKRLGENYIWTVIKDAHIVSGMRIVDRTLYIITTNPWLTNYIIDLNKTL